MKGVLVRLRVPLLVLIGVLGSLALLSVRLLRVPSDSMMPTLVDGDIFLVNQWAYGLTIPFTGKRLFAHAPQRGDVVVFRHPAHPEVLYVKRVAGLPGDHLQLQGGRLLINGSEAPAVSAGLYSDGCYTDMQRVTETLGTHRHDYLYCPVPLQVTAVTPSTCPRRNGHGYLCSPDPDAAAESLTAPTDFTVPAGAYFMLGDNRDNSEDSRYYGAVPEDHLVGSAMRIGYTWDTSSSPGPVFGRSGHRID